MKKSSLDAIWDMVRLRHGIGLRCIEALPPDSLDTHPIRDMRSPKEQVVHMYSFLRAAAESVLSGTLALDEKADVAKVTSKDQLLRYAADSWQAADAAYARITDAHLAGMVKAPWGDMPGSAMISLVPDEYLHHRGQLYAYLRQMGIAPPGNWDFENSAAGLQPKTHATP